MQVDLHIPGLSAISERLDAIESLLARIYERLDQAPKVALEEHETNLMLDTIRAHESQWICGLGSALARRHIVEAFNEGEIANMSRAAVRAKGRSYWMYRGGLGRVSVKQISDAVGGLP